MFFTDWVACEPRQSVSAVVYAFDNTALPAQGLIFIRPNINAKFLYYISKQLIRNLR